jgi:hypothetical protein
MTEEYHESMGPIKNSAPVLSIKAAPVVTGWAY